MLVPFQHCRPSRNTLCMLIFIIHCRRLLVASMQPWPKPSTLQRVIMAAAMAGTAEMAVTAALVTAAALAATLHLAQAQAQAVVHLPAVAASSQGEAASTISWWSFLQAKCLHVLGT